MIAESFPFSPPTRGHFLMTQNAESTKTRTAEVIACTAAASGVALGIASAVTVSIPLVAAAAGLGLIGVAGEYYAQRTPAGTAVQSEGKPRS